LVFNGTATQKGQFVPTAGEGNQSQQSRNQSTGELTYYVRSLPTLRKIPSRN